MTFHNSHYPYVVRQDMDSIQPILVPHPILSMITTAIYYSIRKVYG